MKEKEYKRMISRLKALNTYFMNQTISAADKADREFTFKAMEATAEALGKVEAHYFVVYGKEV